MAFSRGGGEEGEGIRRGAGEAVEASVSSRVYDHRHPTSAGHTTGEEGTNVLTKLAGWGGNATAAARGSRRTGAGKLYDGQVERQRHQGDLARWWRLVFDAGVPITDHRCW